MSLLATVPRLAVRGRPALYCKCAHAGPKSGRISREGHFRRYAPPISGAPLRPKSLGYALQQAHLVTAYALTRIVAVLRRGCSNAVSRALK